MALVQSTAFGGTEQHVALLLRHANRRVPLVTTPAAPPRLLAAARERVLLPPVDRGRVAPQALRRALHRLAPDVVHVHCLNPQHDRVALDVAADVAPVVATLHLPLSLWSVPDVAGLAGTWQRTSAAIVVSRPARDRLVHDLGVDPRRVALVPNGVELPGATAQPAPTTRLVSVARLDRQKGLDVLLEALALLPPGARPEPVVLVGDGPERAALQQQAERLGVAVDLPGHVDDVRPLLLGAGLFVLASREEGLPLALLEAMGAGLPCAATDVGDVAPAVRDAALVVPPEDPAALAAAVASLVRDTGLRARLGRRARARAVAAFDARQAVQRTEAIWSSVHEAAAGGQPSLVPAPALGAHGGNGSEEESS